MKFAIFGVNQAVGHKAAQIAIERNHQVTALITGSLSHAPFDISSNTNISWVVGDVTHAEDIQKTIKHCDGVFASLYDEPNTEYSNLSFVKKVIPLMTKNQKLVIVGHVGVGRSYAIQKAAAKIIIRVVLKEPMADESGMEEFLKQYLPNDFIVLRAQLLQNGMMDLVNVKILDDASGSIFGRTKKEDLAGVAMQIFEGKRRDVVWGNIVCVDSG
ncbi:hypothetical protein NEOLI_001726 [Neolecta irregularis DAH-3]|uniref:NAD(P)-binding domain-containing protein n=1 Tax=Neolecta irregularis (strain DAH-3) TaxID=1198029 RepID=A0A1U7LP24_NEOID|nr:hypothetical protein NEOLI_001726 [Neolecta irregularis DAH-3]|eukprot:OLL24420.1 hypothetical protein NEOLI_001726 [Neolecta irregularis DAH-3]